MDGRGRAMDNILTERLRRSLKCEKVCLNEYDSPREARQHIGRDVEILQLPADPPGSGIPDASAGLL